MKADFCKAVVKSFTVVMFVLLVPFAVSAENGQWTGRDFKKPSREELKKILTPLQFRVTQEMRTEPAFKNEYWNNENAGIYVDIVSGEPLFSSLDKYDSGSGWPSFTKAIEPGNVVEKGARVFFVKKTRVFSAVAGSYLGEVFNDGPGPAGTRYCIDSAALRFVPEAELVKEGYGGYKKLFKKRAGRGK